jgi:hypothetical protein
MENVPVPFKDQMELGEIFSKSGYFPDVKSQYQACVKILAGRELGLNEFESMTGLYFVNGRLGMEAEVMASLVNRSKVYRYVVKSLTDDGCTIDIFREENLVGSSTFSSKDAAKAGLANKDNYKNYPRNMYYARAMANACRWYCPEVIKGYYTRVELEDLTPTPTKTEVVIDVLKEDKI